MARPTTTKQQAALDAFARATHTLICIADFDGTLRDMTDFHGHDWVDGFEWDGNADDPISGATIYLKREIDGLSLAPLMEGSKLNRDIADEYAPHVYPARAVEISTATMLPGEIPEAGDFVPVLVGRIDDPDFGGGGQIVFRARDLMGVWHDSLIETQELYGDDDNPVPMEDVMQAILDDRFGVDEYVLTVVGDPDFGIRATGADGQDYGPLNVSVMEAMRALADLNGWSLHVKWDASESELRPTLYEPDRTNVTPDHTIGPDNYYDVSSLQLSQNGIRNAGKLLYTDLDGEQQEVTDERTASIAEFGRRFILLDERGGQIRTQAQAEKMLGSVLDDTSVPKLTQTIEAAYWWPLEIGDVVLFKANGRHYDTDQTLAVFGLRHVVRGGQVRTLIEARGAPSGGFNRWLRREGRRTEASRTPLARIIINDSDTIEESLQFSGAIYDDGTLEWRFIVQNKLTDFTLDESEWTDDPALPQFEAIPKNGFYASLVTLEVRSTSDPGRVGRATHTVGTAPQGLDADGKIREDGETDQGTAIIDVIDDAERGGFADDDLGDMEANGFLNRTTGEVTDTTGVGERTAEEVVTGTDRATAALDSSNRLTTEVLASALVSDRAASFVASRTGLSGQHWILKTGEDLNLRASDSDPAEPLDGAIIEWDNADYFNAGATVSVPGSSADNIPFGEERWLYYDADTAGGVITASRDDIAGFDRMYLGKITTPASHGGSSTTGGGGENTIPGT